jgi:alkylation response protein AidB-like acyl-CoA dehydrogenase
VAEFVDREVRPVVRELEHANSYPEKLINQMKVMGIFGLASTAPSPRRPGSLTGPAGPGHGTPGTYN